MLTAAQAKRGKLYRRARRSVTCTFYVVPRIAKAAYMAKLQRKYMALEGTEIALLRQHLSDPTAVLLRAVTRYREGKEIKEIKYMALLPADYPMREVKAKPVPKQKAKR